MSFAFAQYKNEWKDTKFDNIRVIKKEFHKSKQPIDLGLVNVDQIVNILLVTKKAKLLNRGVSSYLKWLDT